MCRFVLYLGPPLSIASLVTEPAHSIINQSVHSREAEEPLNGDGFGVAWYAPEIDPRPALFRAVTPAWSNHNLRNLARVTRSRCILAHVRAATSGQPVIETNCHPFVHDRFAFMHNGDVGGFRAIRRELLASLSDESFHAIHGSTDSEHLFAVFLDLLRAAPPDAEPAGAMAAALAGAIARVVGLARSVSVAGSSVSGGPGGAEHSYINIAVSNGVEAVACRFTTDEPRHASSLYVDTGRRYVCEEGVCRMISPEKGQGAVIISSEPLSADGGWHAIPPNHLALVRADRSVELRPVELET